MSCSSLDIELPVHCTPPLQADNEAVVRDLASTDITETRTNNPDNKPLPKKISSRPHRPKRKNVRTGCLTCKVRKVKCDEEKPECRRCKATGRKCDGYTPPMPFRFEQKHQLNAPLQPQFRPNEAFPIYKAPQDDLVARKEMLTFEFVRFKTIPALSGYFSTRFWGDLLSQPSRLEPALWHAVLAVGAFHKESETRGEITCRRQNEETSVRNKAFALHHYTEAISSLRANMASTRSSLSVVLTTCILFVYLEFLRGDFETAAAQIQSGLNIIRDSFRGQAGGKGPTGLDPEKDENENLIQQFYSLGIIGTLFGRPPNDPEAAHGEYQPPSETDGFTSLDKARSGIVQIVAVVAPFVQTVSASYRHLKAEPPVELYMKRFELECHLESWTKAFDRFLEKAHTADPPFSDFRAAKVLQMHHAIASVWLGASFATEECIFDAYTQEFCKILALGKAITAPRCPHTSSPNQTDQHTPTFTFVLGIIPPLYWTAVKCRDPVIRREALQLLIHRTPRQEGLWFAKEVASVACRVIEIEEGRPWDEPLDEQSRQTLPPESARIRRRTGALTRELLPSWCRVRDVKISELMALNDAPAEGRYVTFEMASDVPGKTVFRRDYVKYIDCG